MNYAVGCLLLLLVVLSVATMWRIERFVDSPATTTAATAATATTEATTAAADPTAATAAAATTTNPTDSPTKSTPVAANGQQSTPADAGANPSNQAAITKLLASLITAPPTTASVPDASSGTKSTPSDADALTYTQCDTKITSSTKPYRDALVSLKRKYEALEHKVQSEPTQRCPNMRDYVRKDSIPCYNCTL